jgi:hypothetical protein
LGKPLNFMSLTVFLWEVHSYCRAKDNYSMKTLSFFLTASIAAATATGQAISAPYWSITPSFNYELYSNGSLNDNDPHYPADTISFKQDLRHTSWSSGALNIRRVFKNHNALSLSGEYFFITGLDSTDRNIWFNGVLLGSRGGITIDHSRIIRVQANYEWLLSKQESHSRLTAIAGLIYDYQLIEITTRILNDADTVLLEEDFNDQVIPYPQIGARFEQDLNEHSHLIVQATGTYIPRSKHSDIRKPSSFRYYCFTSNLFYQYTTGSFSFMPGLSYRVFDTAEDEGKHNFNISLFGAIAAIEVRF